MPSSIRFHYDPFVELDRLLDDAFSARVPSCTPSAEVCQRPKAPSLGAFRPRLDLHASKDSNVVTATFDLPGFTSENVSIEVQNDRLTVSGGSSASGSHEEGGYAVRERHRGKFSRSIQLPLGTKPDDVKAKMENGLLTVTFPRGAPEQQIHRITVQ